MILLNILRLVLPALIPSWRFFDEIAPAPRIEYALLQGPHDEPVQWTLFRPRPAHLRGATLLPRLFWNPHWNETLFLMSCSERLIENGDPFCMPAILERIRRDLPRNAPEPYLKFRLVTVHREGDELHQQVVFVSPSIGPGDGEAP